MTEPVNNQWIDELLKPLSDGGYHNNSDDKTRSTCHDCKIIDRAKSAILSKLESIEQEAELYGRLHETIEMFQSGTIASYKYSQRHAELTEQISQLKLGVTT